MNVANEAQLASPNRQARADIVTACLAVLVREMREARVPENIALDALRDAPSKIDAALTRGSGALVVYSLSPNGARGIVTTDTEKLQRFAFAADLPGCGLIGLNPSRIAALVAQAQHEASGGKTRKEPIQ